MGGRRETRNLYIAKAPPAVAGRFTDDLQDTLDRIPQEDVLLLLGDFNARVGSSQGQGDRVRGRHGVGNCNEAGERLLALCATNQLSQKKQHHLTTWKHPATKQMHMIDYAIMRTDQRSFCSDVQVMRGANCWSDHCMVRVKIRMQLPSRRKTPMRMPISGHNLRRAEISQRYQQRLKESLQSHPHNHSDTVEQNWSTLRDCIVSVGEEVVARGRQRQPDWFVEAADTLQPLLEEKNRAHKVWLQNGRAAEKRLCRQQQRLVKRAVDAAKEDWITKMVREIEKRWSGEMEMH